MTGVPDRRLTVGRGRGVGGRGSALPERTRIRRSLRGPAVRDGILIAAVDGTGHGAEAAAAAKIAAATLEAHAWESPIALLLRCHDELKGTRGAVMTLAFIHLRDRTLTWLGVGNVEAVLFHGRAMSQRAGSCAAAQRRDRVSAAARCAPRCSP